MYLWLIPLALLIVCEAIADLLAKHWSLHAGTLVGITALIGYLVGNIFWLYALKDGAGLGRGAAIFSVATEIMALIIAFVVYHERISSLQGIGIVLGIISIIFLVWE